MSLARSPNHVITLVQPKPNQPPTYATFLVPLKFNKLDLRDYLYHAYDVEVLSVRSFINQQKPRQPFEENGAKFGKWYRPLSKKMMTVELAKPFVFPKAPEDLEPWDQEMYDRLRKAQRGQLEARERIMAGKYPLREELEIQPQRVELARQAADLRKGKTQWKNDVVLDDKWEELERIQKTKEKSS